jgi:hypothetical protein
VPLPWSKPRHELLLLGLVAVVALLPVYTIFAQDQSRLCLAQAILHGRLSNDACLARSVDKARFDGHLYSDKAPGLSFLQVPVVAATRLPPAQKLEGKEVRTWIVRLTTTGVAFLVGVFLVGRVAEGLAPGRGALALVTFGLGTLFTPLAAIGFGHVSAGVMAFGAFLLAWRGRFGAAGVAAGAAVVTEYQTAAILVLLAAYVALRGLRALGRYALGVVPAAAVLGTYDALAFGSPFHLSYRYIVGSYQQRQATGFFGIGVPPLHSIHEVFVGDRGLLVISPVVVAAAYGLVLLGKRALPEAALCGAVTVFFVLLNCGYFLPYGGGSPGPRFLVPALPFLAVGLGPAFARRPLATGVLAVASVIATVTLTLVWNAVAPIRGTIWSELAHAVVEGRSSHLVRRLVGRTAFTWLDSSAGAFVIVAAAVAAVAVAFVPALGLGRPRATQRWRVASAAVVLAALLATAVRAALLPLDLRTTVSATSLFAFPGDEVDFNVALTNRTGDGFTHVRLHVVLPSGVQLLGPPVFERGSGCSGNETLDCNLDFLEPRMSTNIRFGVRVLPDAPPKVHVRAWGSARSGTGPKTSVAVVTGSG